jgi:hypothetical protein
MIDREVLLNLNLEKDKADRSFLFNGGINPEERRGR